MSCDLEWQELGASQEVGGLQAWAPIISKEALSVGSREAVVGAGVLVLGLLLPTSALAPCTLPQTLHTSSRITPSPDFTRTPSLPYYQMSYRVLNWPKCPRNSTFTGCRHPRTTCVSVSVSIPPVADGQPGCLVSVPAQSSLGRASSGWATQPDHTCPPPPPSPARALAGATPRNQARIKNMFARSWEILLN